MLYPAAEIGFLMVLNAHLVMMCCYAAVRRKYACAVQFFEDFEGFSRFIFYLERFVVPLPLIVNYVFFTCSV